MLVKNSEKLRLDDEHDSNTQSLVSKLGSVVHDVREPFESCVDENGGVDDFTASSGNDFDVMLDSVFTIS